MPHPTPRGPTPAQAGMWAGRERPQGCRRERAPHREAGVAGLDAQLGQHPDAVGQLERLVEHVLALHIPPGHGEDVAALQPAAHGLWGSQGQKWGIWRSRLGSGHRTAWTGAGLGSPTRIEGAVSDLELGFVLIGNVLPRGQEHLPVCRGTGRTPLSTLIGKQGQLDPAPETRVAPSQPLLLPSANPELMF